MLAYLLGFSDCRELLSGSDHRSLERVALHTAPFPGQGHTHGGARLPEHTPVPACGKTEGADGPAKLLSGKGRDQLIGYPPSP